MSKRTMSAKVRKEIRRLENEADSVEADLQRAQADPAPHRHESSLERARQRVVRIRDDLAALRINAGRVLSRELESLRKGK